jgi:hypothetical protein
VVRYGDKSRYAPVKEVSHSIGCNNNVFGDPAPGVAKVLRVTKRERGSEEGVCVRVCALSAVESRDG